MPLALPSALLTEIAKTIPADDCDASDDVRQAAYVARQLLRCKMPPCYRTLYMKGVQGLLRQSTYVQGFNEDQLCAVFAGSSCVGHS